MGRVAEEYDVAAPPTLVSYRREPDPPGVVRDQPMAGQDVGEKLLATGDALKVGFARCEVARREPIEACRSPHPLVHLHDERAVRCVLVSPAARPVVLGAGGA